MRRREKKNPLGIPERLLRYVAEEWPDGPQAFWDARMAWLDAHPQSEVPFPPDNGPDVPFDPSTV